MTSPLEAASFDLFQDRVLTTSCATPGCHASTSDVSFKQHGLVLAKGVAHQNLVNVMSSNPDAKADELLRVKPYGSESCLLFHKLSPNGSAHHSGKNYGSTLFHRSNWSLSHRVDSHRASRMLSLSAFCCGERKQRNSA